MDPKDKYADEPPRAWYAIQDSLGRLIDGNFAEDIERQGRHTLMVFPTRREARRIVDQARRRWGNECRSIAAVPIEIYYMDDLGVQP